ncbi:hypothetical protein [Paracoccus methylarcula]|nr:hypothetical protein [Paracoccus methylarcula]
MMTLFAILVGIVAGPLLALATRSPAQRRGFAKREEKFRQGIGRDPNRALFGPHKPFWWNALFWGVIFAAIFAAIGQMGPT